MKKIPLKKKTSKQDAWHFTAALLGNAQLDTTKQEDFEKKKKSSTSESVVQSRIIDMLIQEEAKGTLMFQRTNNTPIYDEKIGGYRALPKGTRAGFPDIFVMIKGRAVFLEVKSHKGNQSEKQVIMQNLLEKHGAEYYIVRSTEGAKKALFFTD